MTGSIKKVLAKESECQHDKTTERDIMPPSTTASFTDEQERRFQIRFEEGFNVFTDDDYVSWLEIHHPESLPHSTPEDFTLVGQFSSVSPAVQVAIDSTLPESPVTENTPSTSFQSPATETPRLIRLQSWTNVMSRQTPRTLPPQVASLHRPSLPPRLHPQSLPP
jgi:hypothetical protein